jgi:hypothetical protein
MVVCQADGPGAEGWHVVAEPTGRHLPPAPPVRPVDLEPPGPADDDPKLAEAVALVRETGKAANVFFQKHSHIGRKRAQRLLAQLIRDGVLGPDLEIRETARS